MCNARGKPVPSGPSLPLLVLCVVATGCMAACGGGGGSNLGGSESVSNPVPAITSLSPSSTGAGGPNFTLTVNGSSFISSSTVEWNGSPLSSTFVSSSELQASVPASDVSAAGNAEVTVVNPAPGGGTSNALAFSVEPPPATAVNQPANDIVWDPTQQVMYLSVPSSAGSATGNTISVLDPATGQLTLSVFAGSEPDVLAISDDSALLYVGLDGSSTVQRFALPTLATDISYPLGSNSSFGPYFALDLQVAPGSPRTTSVTLGLPNMIPEAIGGIEIFDDATMRPTTAPGFGPGGGGSVLYDSLQWGSDATALYAANNESTGFDFYTLSVNASGVTLVHDYPGLFSDFYIRIHFDRGTQLIYSDDGHIVIPSTGLPAGVFAASGVMVPDSTVNKAFFLGQTASQSGSEAFTIESFDLARFTPIDSVTIPNVSGYPLRLIRWGTSGLAFNTTGGQVFLYSGSLVTETTTAQNREKLLADPVRRTWKHRKIYPSPRQKQ